MIEQGCTSDLIDGAARDDKERADRWLAEQRECWERKQARLDAMHEPRPYDQEKES